MNSIFGITVTPFQRTGGIYVAAIFTAQKEKKKKTTIKQFTGKMYFVRKLYFLSELGVHLNVVKCERFKNESLLKPLEQGRRRYCASLPRYYRV